MFGSARSRSRKQYEADVKLIEKEIANAASPEARAAAETRLKRLRATEWTCDMFDKVKEVRFSVMDPKLHASRVVLIFPPPACGPLVVSTSDQVVL